MRKKNFFTFCAAAAMLPGTGAANAATTIDSWTSGSTTVVLTDDGVLTVTGTGAMANYSFDAMAPWRYASRDAIKTLVINDGVTSIGDLAFFGCNGLTSVTIPNNVTSIGESAFSTCSGLTAINVDAANTGYSSIDGVLYNRNQDTLVMYPAGKSGALTIPNSVTSIGEDAFHSCSGLTSVTIPNSVTSIGEWAFSNCSGLTSVTIPNSVTSIGEWAFSWCSGLTSVTIPNGVTGIGKGVFFCSGLTSVTISNSVTSIGNGAFYQCSGLTAINVDAANTQYSSVDGVLYNRNQDTLVVCPAGKSGALTIPNSVTSIGEDAFENCIGLTSVTIPNSVTSIGDWAFENCSGLSVFCLAATPPTLTLNDVDKWFFSRVDTLYVPESALNAYKNSNWSKAFRIILAIESAQHKNG